MPKPDRRPGRSSAPDPVGAVARVLVLAAALLAASPAGAVTWELLTAFAPDAAPSRNVAQFAAEVAQASAGALQIVVLADPARLRGPEIAGAVAAGRMPAGELMLADLAGENAVFAVDAVPFLARSFDDARALWEASRPEIEPLLAARGLHLAFAVAGPPQGLFVDRDLTTVADLRGVRLLDDAPMTQRLAVLLGAVPVEQPSGSLAEAFRADRLDAAIASLPAGAALQAWTFVPNFYDLRVTLPKSVVVFNATAYRALDPAIQRAVLNAAVGAHNRGWQASGTAHNEAIDAMEARGMTVTVPGPVLQRSLQAAGERMTEEWAARTGLEGRQILDTYRAARGG